MWQPGLTEKGKKERKGVVLEDLIVLSKMLPPQKAPGKMGKGLASGCGCVSCSCHGKLSRNLEALGMLSWRVSFPPSFSCPFRIRAHMHRGWRRESAVAKRAWEMSHLPLACPTESRDSCSQDNSA